ncbi:hypothetical protein Rsub_02331 [Raphidocelis subcapitata]|uniref:Uncharacterized protein n=1 Tax=Raphidocelis subcapitata TaxID=307507 RepID=A0A2V0NVN4_9CHLO|nr:hypothetical protein Rsub_02331 [Raphidocelis subcapitata]|eukprot:GBF89613.1 hypothetical protein Rsub_02331 [Raphidocelis subcapitata]
MGPRERPPEGGGSGGRPAAPDPQQQRGGGTWRLAPSDLRIAPDPAALANLQPESLRVHLPRDAAGDSMPALSSRAVHRFCCELPPAGAAAGPPPAAPRPAQRPRQQPAGAAGGGGGQSREFATDSVLFAGGPVWAADWCPFPADRPRPGPSDACELLALGTHPKGLPRTRIASLQRGPGALQLWAVPHSAPAAAGAGAGAAAGAGAGAGAGAASAPRCLALLQHGGRLAWDLKWCPDPSALVAGGGGALADAKLAAPPDGGGGGRGGGGQLPLQGVLAAVLGDGSVQVYAVPAMHHLAALRPPNQQQQQRRQAGDAGADDDAARAAAAAAAAGCAVLDLPPVASLSPDAAAGSLASCCAWVPAAPHDLLLVGGWDGHVEVWRLPTAPGGAPCLVLRLRAEHCALRCVAWQPDPPESAAPRGGASAAPAAAVAAPSGGGNAAAGGAASGGGAAAAASTVAGGRCFLTASQFGDLRIWDPRDPFSPVASRSFYTIPITSCVWAGNPGAIVITQADGGPKVVFASVTGIGSMVKTGIKTSAMFLEGPDPAPVWSVTMHPAARVAAYCGDSGVLGLVPIEPPVSSRRHQKPAAAVSAVAVDGGDAWLLDYRQLSTTNAGLYEGGAHHRPAAPAAEAAEAARRGTLLDPRQALFAAAFSPNAVGGAAFLAAGGAAGLVRVHRLQVVLQGSSEDVLVE